MGQLECLLGLSWSVAVHLLRYIPQMRACFVLLLWCLVLVGHAQPLPTTSTIAGTRFGALDIDVHPSGEYVAVAVAGWSPQWWIYQFETGYAQLVKKVPLPALPHQVRYSPDGFWAVVNYGSGNCDIYRTPRWDFYASIRKNSGGLGYAEFDGVSRHLGIQGEYIYRMSDLQPMLVTRQGNHYTFSSFIGLEAVISIWGVWGGGNRLIEAETLEELDSKSFPYGGGIFPPHRSGIFGYLNGNGPLTLHEYEHDKILLRSASSGLSYISNVRLSPTAQFITYCRQADPGTLGVMGFDPVLFSFDEHFGYSGHLQTGYAKGAVFAPPDWQLGQVRIASMTQGGDAGWLKMPEKWLLVDFLPHVGTVTQASSPQDPREMAVAAYLGSAFKKGIRIWSVPDTGAPVVKKVLKSTDTVRRLHYFQKGARLAAVHDAFVEVWDLAGDGNTPLGTVEIGSPIRKSSCASDQLCLTKSSGEVLMLDLQALTLRSLGTVTNASGAYLSPDAQKVAVVGEGISIRSTQDFTPLSFLSPNGNYLSSCTWSPDGRWLFSGSNGGGSAYVTKFPMTKLKGDKVVERAFPTDGNAPHIEVSPDGGSISAYVAYATKLRLLDTNTLRTLREYDGDVSGLAEPGGVAYLAGGQRMAVATLDGPIGILRNPVAKKIIKQNP